MRKDKEEFLSEVFEAISDQMFSDDSPVMVGMFVRGCFPLLSKVKEIEIITTPGNDVEAHISIKEKT